MSYEVSSISYIDIPISDKDKATPHKVILNLKGLTEETKEENIFISIEKNHHSNYILYYKKKFHRDTLTILDYLLAIIEKQY